MEKDQRMPEKIHEWVAPLAGEASARLGDREPDWELNGVYCGKGNPYIRACETAKSFSIHLTEVVIDDKRELIYQLSHEIVHCLNPEAGFTNYLEEGMAVMFAKTMLSGYGYDHADLPNNENYKKAYELVCQLPTDPYITIKKYRGNSCRSIRSIERKELKAMFPEICDELCDMLLAEFKV